MDTTIGNLKVGSQLVLGKYGVQDDDPYPIVWLKGTPECDFITEKAVDYLCFDAPERNGIGRSIGLATHTASNLFSFLNSDEAEWFRATHENDEPPGNVLRYAYARYQNHSGFLHHFEEHELASIVLTTYTADNEQVSSLVRLPSIADVTPGDSRMKVFARKGIRPNPTEDLFFYKSRYAELSSEQGFVKFWVRNDGEPTRYVPIINRSGFLDNQMASVCAGVRPVCTLNPDTVVYQHDDGRFYIKPFVVESCAFTDTELFELLGLA